MRPFTIPDVHSGKTLSLIAGPLIFACVLAWGNLDPTQPEATAMAAIVAWVAIWWFMEPVDLAVTALLPFVLIPLLGISSPGETASQYMDPIIFLFLGGFMLAFAMERWQLHTRLALGILSRTGAAPNRILAGVMGTAFFVSMWVSNTATVLMLIPAVMAVIDHIRGEQKNAPTSPLATALLLGLAYAATLGGMSTLVGTPPNMYFYSYYQRTFPGDASMNFASFFAQAGLITIVLALVTYLLLRFRYLRTQTGHLPGHYFKNSYRALGKLSIDQRIVAGIFFVTVIAWFTRPDMAFGDTLFRGWASLSGLGDRVNDGIIVIVACLLLFVLPASTEKGRLLEWRDIQRLPFGIVLLFGSGFALAMGFEQSGLSKWLAGHLEGLQSVHPLILLLTVGAIITIISEFASNIACIQLVLPVLATLADDGPLPLKGLMVATALFASLGFMMPVATPPNTIVFGSGLVRTRDMVRTGFWVNIAGIVIISLVIYALYA